MYKSYAYDVMCIADVMCIIYMHVTISNHWSWGVPYIYIYNTCVYEPIKSSFTMFHERMDMIWHDMTWFMIQCFLCPAEYAHLPGLVAWTYIFGRSIKNVMGWLSWRAALLDCCSIRLAQLAPNKRKIPIAPLLAHLNHHIISPKRWYIYIYIQ